jgi:hypothetical protein
MNGLAGILRRDWSRWSDVGDFLAASALCCLLLSAEAGFPNAMQRVDGLEVLRFGAAVVAEQYVVAEFELGRAHAGSDASVVVGPGVGRFPVCALGMTKLKIEHAGFKTAGTLHSELCVRDVIDQLEFLDIGGLIVLYQRRAHFVESGGILVREHRRQCGHAMLERIHTTARLARLSARAGGPAGIAAIRFSLFLCGHCSSLVLVGDLRPR